jgi:phosphoglycerate kinase
MRIKSIKNAPHLAGRRVLLRTDLNVPIKNNIIQDDFKIIQALATIDFLLAKKAKIILLTHLGEPKGGKPDQDFSVKPIAGLLSKILDQAVEFVPYITGLEVGTAVSRMKNAGIILLENVRFDEREKKNSQKLAKELASFADVYVNDAFAVSHRKHASVSAIKNYLASYAGLLLEKEVMNLERGLYPDKPLVVVIGGAKISTKITLIKNLQKKAWRILIGGGIANNFFAARGLEVGKSLIDKNSLSFARRFSADNIILPVDVIVANSDKDEASEVKSINNILKNDYIFDIGPKTLRLYANFIKSAKTLIWNGPMGMFELKKFKHGTLGIAREIGLHSRGKAFGVAGGGETVAALRMAKMVDDVDWVSTGGGAMLSYLGNEPMPGLKGLIK